MRHYFDTAVAKDCGINAAIVFENIKFWVEHNRKIGKNERDGRHWMYQTQAELSEQFDYLSVKQVRTALTKLEEAGYIERGNFNRHKYDRTTWYSVTDKADEQAAEEVNEQAQDSTPQTDAPSVTANAETAESGYPKRDAQQNARKQPSDPRRARGDGVRYNGRGRKQKPKWAHPVPDWLDGRAEKVATIQDIKSKIEKDKMMKRIKALAADCGAVCNV